MHASRQSRYRLRRELLCVGMQVVTDHSSTMRPFSDTLSAWVMSPTDTEGVTVDEQATRECAACDFCGQICGPFVHRWSSW